MALYDICPALMSVKPIHQGMRNSTVYSWHGFIRSMPSFNECKSLHQGMRNSTVYSWHDLIRYMPSFNECKAYTSRHAIYTVCSWHCCVNGDRWPYYWFDYLHSIKRRATHHFSTLTLILYSTRGGVVVKLLTCGTRGRGSIPGLAATISEIWYILPPNRDLAEILLERRKSSKQQTNQRGRSEFITCIFVAFVQLLTVLDITYICQRARTCRFCLTLYDPNTHQTMNNLMLPRVEILYRTYLNMTFKRGLSGDLIGEWRLRMKR